MQTNRLIHSIGAAIKHHRVAKKISLSALAKEAKVSKSTLFALELGDSNPTISTLEAISVALNVELKELLQDRKRDNNSLQLIENTKSNKGSLYQLNLEPLEEFSYSNTNSQSLKINIIEGAITVLETNTTLTKNSKMQLPNSFRAVAGKDGAKAIIFIAATESSILLSEDIFIDTLTKESLQELSINSYSSSISRVILPPATTVPQCKNIPHTTILSNKTNNAIELYIFSRYQGLKSQYRELLSSITADRLIDKNLHLIDKLIYSIPLLENDFKEITIHPITFLETKLIEEHQSTHKSAKKIEPSHLLLRKLESNQNYAITTELLDSSYSTAALSATLVANIYRAIEDMVSIKTDELRVQEIKLFNEVNKILPQAYYYAFCEKCDVATTLLQELDTKISRFFKQEKVIHSAFKIFYTKLFTTIENALEMYNNNRVYFDKEKFETFIRDSGATIEYATLLQKGVRGGRYLYFIRGSLKSD
ncbi:MAG TPA: XRE family transcriptional regulator [Nitratifractor sp.]|nr:XRE family transcriptional regulator [Nitratifractor sp.]HHH21028.1 XRE family transcriptional regulator [Nitratifractor sp.]